MVLEVQEKTTVRDIKAIAMDILDQLSYYEDDDEVHTYGNTFFVQYPMELADGFVDYTSIRLEKEFDD